MHPAILDMAQIAPSLITDHGGEKGFYVPVNYGSVKVFAPLTAKLYSHIRYRPSGRSNNDLAVFDATLFDERGVTLVEIKELVTRRVTKVDVEVSENRQDGELLESSRQDGLEHAITPEEGVEAFCRVLSSSIHPQIVVASQDLNALIAAADNTGMVAVSENDGQPQPVVVEKARPNLSTVYVPPRTELEEKLTAVWKELLGIDEVGVHDDFMELGGHSLLFAQAISRVRGIVEANLRLEALFKTPTIAAFAQLIENSTGTEDEHTVPEIVPASRSTYRMKRSSVAYVN